MAIVGFSFMKVGVEKKPLVSKEVKVTNDLKLGKVELAKRNDFSGSDAARFNFEFKVVYGDIGNIDLAGYLLYADEPKKLKEIVETWEKEKRLPALLVQQVLNAILVKCNVKALELAQDVGLPPHFELPKLKMSLPAKKEQK
ncbi:MAG TPA: hypothetical protein VFE88_03500 [Candidatus Nanoarchaeia archaeon]|nr:hypothetical protein [Candidatus Nanoarchaeia archaeon]